MIKSFCYRLSMVAVLFLCVMGLSQANPCQTSNLRTLAPSLCDVTFTATPTFVTPMTVGTAQTGIYTITNNTPVTVSLSAITTVPTNAAVTRDTGVANNCGATLASGASCNIKINIAPTASGTIPTFKVEVTFGDPRGGTACSIESGAITVNPAAAITGFDFATYPSLALCSVLANSTITNTGATAVTGDICLTPGTSITGFPPGTFTGAEHVDDAYAASALAANNALYTALAGLTCPAGAYPAGNVLTGLTLGTGVPTLTPGVYCFSTTAQLTGTLTLDCSADPDGLFVFQIGSTLTTASASAVVLDANCSAANVYWQVGSSATFGTTTAFQGTVLSQASDTFNTGATLENGRVVALTGAVTLADNTIVPAP